MNLRLEDLTTEQKIGMLLCGRRFEGEDLDTVLDLVKNHSIGCVQVPANHPEIVKLIKETADYPILVINDMESGFPTSSLPKIPLMSISACNKPEYYHAFARGVVRDAKAAGYSGTWNPVVDILRGDGPCAVSRSFSDNPQKVAEAAAELAGIYNRNNFLACAKHYPGGDDQHVDTHMVEGVSNVTEKELIEFDLVPYKYLMDRGLIQCIMTRHTVYKNIDPDRPASLSKKVIDIIRNMGFDGVAFTDSLAMMGILQKFGEENVYGMAIEAGNDIVLPNYRTPVKQCYEMLLKNYRDGAFTEERLNEAVRRILTAQEYAASEPENPTVFTAEDEKTLDDIARDCITAVTDDGVSPALGGNNEDKIFIVLTDEQSPDNIDNPEVNTRKWYFSDRVAKRIEEKFPGAGIEFLPEFPGGSHNERVLNAATKYKEAIFVTFCRTGAYYGTDCLTRRVESVVNALVQSGKVKAIVHFGNPYAVEKLNHVPRMLFGYNIPDSQLYAIDVLKGEMDAKGTLPFDVKVN